MTDVLVAAPQQQNVESKRQKRSRSPGNAEPLEVAMPESQVKYLRELCQLWEDAS